MIGPKKWLFAAADSGVETRARAMPVIETAKRNSVTPQPFPADCLSRIYGRQIIGMEEFMPWNRAPAALDNKQRYHWGGYGASTVCPPAPPHGSELADHLKSK
jgi:hypothetical protein